MNVARIGQVRIDALSSKYIYTKKLMFLNVWIIIIDILTIIVPVLFLSILFIAKGTEYEYIISLISIILSSVLISLSILKYVLNFSSKNDLYKDLMSRNISLSEEALDILSSPNSHNSSDENWLLKQSRMLNNEDQKIIGDVKRSIKQKAYRQALMEFLPGDISTTCPVCNASPWIYKKGKCQTCGNTKQ